MRRPSLRQWDLDRYPWVRFAYRIPRGVPVGVALDAFTAAGSSGTRRITLGGSPACLAAAKPDLECCRLTDDGQWHSVTFDARAIRAVCPDVKRLQGFRFYAPLPFKAGQQWWLDDFAISPRQ